VRPLADDRAEAAYLRTPQAIRARAEALYRLGMRGELAHFSIDESRLPSLVDRVVRVTRAVYPDVRVIPNHTRFRHFGVGGVDRIARLDVLAPEARLCAKLELAITSVLLDAGAGERWAYREPGGGTYARSEGLAVASYHLFTSGALSDDPVREPLRADAAAMIRLSAEDLGRAFQVSAENPLVGVGGRLAILRGLGEAIDRRPEMFRGRLGNLGAYLALQAQEGAGALPASAVLAAVLDAFNLGDVWTHPAVGRVPFHKLSQWLTYSLCEPLDESGLRITGMDQLTGLAEYRNGGLFVDGGVLIPKQPGVLSETHDVSSALVVEWRALTVALLDRTAVEMRRQLGLSSDQLPLAKVLEGGTWRAGRELARERRSDGAPPIHVNSDGTVF
jgi:hypothetical protein